MLDQYQNSAPASPDVVSGYQLARENSRGANFNSADSFVSNYSAMADAQNQLNMAKYNNDYNYWLWQQQTDYNSPVNQRKRLEEAGLNPNFNSIEGAGNASSPAPSQGKLNTNFLGAYQASISEKELRLQQANSILNGVNNLVKNIGEGFDMARTYANTPSGIQSFRQLLYDQLKNVVDFGSKNKERADWSVRKLISEAGIASSRDEQFRWMIGGPSQIRELSPYAQQFISNTNKILGQTEYMRKQGLLTDKQAAKIGAETLLTNVRRDIAAWERDAYNPQKLDNVKKQFELMEAQLTRALFENKYMKGDKWFDYVTRGIGSLTGGMQSIGGAYGNFMKYPLYF